MAVVWITGARGFIGRHLARLLRDQGREVMGIGHGAWPSSEAARSGVVQWLNGDITASNLNSLRASGGIPDAVFHLAGGSSVGAAVERPYEDFTRTVATTVELFEWLRQQSPNTIVIAVSSAAVYGAGHLGPISEQATLRPHSPYGYHKLMMEMVCRSYGASFAIRSVVARLFSVYGAGLKKQLLWDLCNKLVRRHPSVELAGTGEEKRDWTDIRDVTRALSALVPMASANVPTWNIGTGVASRVRDIAELVLKSWERDTEVALYFTGSPRAGDPFSLQADCARSEANGINCKIDAADGISEYVSWYQAQQETRK